jgi:parallel beta-helix repeat protein
MKKRVMFCAMICFFLISFSAAASDVLRVPNDFGTIQQAIDAAPTDAIIQVAAGTYCENLVIARSDVRLHAGPSGRVVLSGSCSPDPIGILITGFAGVAVSNVEVKGFVVQGYEAGIWLYEVTDSRVHRNLVEGNVSGASPKLDGAHSGQGILLERAHFNEVVQNESRGNGWLGVGILNGSNNLVRANRIIDNGADHPIPDRWCKVMIWGTSTGNRFVENEVSGERGMAVMLGPGATSGNLVAQNRIRGHALEGIWVTASTFGNIITQNDARGNALNGDGYDLDDLSESANTWRRNLGSCAPDSGLCRE